VPLQQPLGATSGTRVVVPLEPPQQLAFTTKTYRRAIHGKAIGLK